MVLFQYIILINCITRSNNPKRCISLDIYMFFRYFIQNILSFIKFWSNQCSSIYLYYLIMDCKKFRKIFKCFSIRKSFSLFFMVSSEKLWKILHMHNHVGVIFALQRVKLNLYFISLCTKPI